MSKNTTEEKAREVNMFESTTKHIAKICKVVEDLTFDGQEVWGMDESRTIMISRITETEFPKKATVNAEILGRVLKRCESTWLTFEKNKLVVRSIGQIEKTFKIPVLETEKKPNLKIDMKKYAWVTLPVSIFKEIMDDVLKSDEMILEVNENGFMVFSEEDGTVFSAVINDQDMVDYEGKGKVKVDPQLLKKIVDVLEKQGDMKIGIAKDKPVYIENFNAKIFIAPRMDTE